MLKLYDSFSPTSYSSKTHTQNKKRGKETTLHHMSNEKAVAVVVDIIMEQVQKIYKIKYSLVDYRFMWIRKD